MANSQDENRDCDQQSSQSHETRTLHSYEIFGEDRVVFIRHGDEMYRLLQTKNGKLILQK